MMVGRREVPNPHRVSLHTTRPPYRRNRWNISGPGRNSHFSSTRKKRFQVMWQTTMTTSRIREIMVAMAAPATPRAGAPRLPKISTQFKKRLVHMETPSTYIPSLGRSMLR